MLLGQTIGFQLALEQVAPRDLQLLLLGVAGELDDFHAIAQRRRNRIEHIGGGDEQHLRQIERYAQVIVAECIVLLRVQHFEKRGKRVALIACRELVDFIEHQNRIAPAGLAHRLHDVPGQRADVGASMAANFGFIVHAAQAHAAEFKADGFGNALTQRGLAHARRPDKAQNRAAALGIEFAHGQELENPALDLGEPVVIFVEYFSRLFDVDLLGIEFGPGHGEQPLQIGSGHRVLGRLFRHPFQTIELALRLLFDFRRHAGILDRLLQVRQL